LKGFVTSKEPANATIEKCRLRWRIRVYNTGGGLKRWIQFHIALFISLRYGAQKVTFKPLHFIEFDHVRRRQGFDKKLHDPGLN